MYYFPWYCVVVISVAVSFVQCDGDTDHRTPEAINVNHLADPIIDQFSNEILAEGKDRAKVKDFDENYMVGILGRKLSLLEFQCRNGWVRDISSIKRQGDVLLHTGKIPISLQIPFGFKTLQYTCDSYLLRVPILRFSGLLQADVASNLVDLKISIDYIDDKCRFRVDHLIVKRLDGINVRVTGFSILNGLFNRIVTWIARSFRETIEKQIVEQVHVSLKNIVEESDLCYEHNLSLNGTERNRLLPLIALAKAQEDRDMGQNKPPR